MLIYKIFRAPEWDELDTKGETLGAPIDLADGYIHLSTADQVVETCAKYFAGVEGLVLLALESDDLKENLKWEKSRGDNLFPHLYRRLKLSDVKWRKNLPVGKNGHVFPDNIV